MVTSPLVMEARGFSQPAGLTKPVSAHGSGFAIRSKKRASMPSVGKARSPAKSAHRTYLATGESDREIGKAGQQTRVPQRGRRRQRARQSLLHQFVRRHPAQKQMEPFQTAEEATWHTERTRLAPTGNATEGMSGSASQAKEAYAKFHDLWKGADTDLSALQQARAE